MVVGSASSLPEVDGLGRRERRKLEVRTRILEAGMALFEAQGIDRSLVSEICARADVAHKTFFNHFPSKRHLLREIAQHGLRQLLADIEEARKQPLTTRGRIQHFFARIADNATAAGPMHRELLAEMVHLAHETGDESEQARMLKDAFGALIREGIVAGDVSDRHSPETLTEMLQGAFYVLMFNWANLHEYPLRERALALARLVGDAVCTPERATKRGERS